MPAMQLRPRSSFAKLIISCNPAARPSSVPRLWDSLYLSLPSWYQLVRCHAAILHQHQNDSVTVGRCVSVVCFRLVFGFGGFWFSFSWFLISDRHSWVARLELGRGGKSTYRHKAAGAVSTSNRGGRIAHELLHGIRGYEIAQNHQKGEDEFHTESFPGGQSSAMWDGGLQIPLVTRHSYAVK